ncbi:hypothetical protein C8Q73DRAFT_349807 [Cubamyces lactineus]|nr:hypothetical protein C8Q73DRAFT_349807 [Cubamyces lactineus]
MRTRSERLKRPTAAALESASTVGTSTASRRPRKSVSTSSAPRTRTANSSTSARTTGSRGKPQHRLQHLQAAAPKQNLCPPCVPHVPTFLHPVHRARRLKSPRISRSSSASTSRTPGRTKLDIVDDIPSRLSKRKRVAAEDEETESLAKRLKEADKVIRRREAELKKREAALARKENALTRKEGTITRELERLAQRKNTLAAKKRDLDAQSKDVNMEAVAKTAVSSPTVDPLWALSHLEEHFTCSLCYEIMACPYSLTPGRCGHSFCALCVLKWCFAAVHRGCGYWHDSLECPLCRAELPYTSDLTPRSIFSFPFSPNRLADCAIKALVDIVKNAKPETGAGSACVAAAAGGSTIKGSTALATSDADKLLSWREGGMYYEDWYMRDKRGRSEMTLLANEWTLLQADDFVAFKDRLSA